MTARARGRVIRVMGATARVGGASGMRPRCLSARAVGLPTDRIVLFADVATVMGMPASVLREDEVVGARGSQPVGPDAFVREVISYAG